MSGAASDFPFNEVYAKACELIEQDVGTVFQKFTCEHCGQRLTMDVPNTFYAEGGCDKCGRMTDIKKAGCNYMLVAKVHT